MNIYFDTEFTGLDHKDPDLISLGCVAETGEVFYAEFTDYDISKCDDWVKEHVIANLILDEGDYYHNFHVISEFVDGDDKDNRVTTCVGNTKLVCEALDDWLTQFDNEPIQFVSDVCHYDFYLLCNQIFGGAFNLPVNVCPACYDICQDLVDENDGDIKDMFDAFNYSREEACKFYNKGKLPEGVKHNSLYDAMVIKMIYEGMRR